VNFLELAQRARRRCRVIGSGPSAITGQSEEYARLIDFVNEAWMSIQELHQNWQWMRQTTTFPTVAGQAEYTLAQIQATGTNFSDFGFWDNYSFRAYSTSIGLPDERMLDYSPYEDWHDYYQLGSLRTSNSMPVDATVLPALGVGIGPTPIAGYTISGDYYKKATELVASTDEPGLPSQYHMLIVYRVMMLYGAGEAAGEVFEMGKNLYGEMLNRLELQQLPEMDMAGPLV
jgi:hypothetical protein